MVAVRIPNMLRTYSGWQETTHVDASTVGDVLRDLVSVDPDVGAIVLDEAGNIGIHLAVYCDDLPVVRDDWETVQVSSSDQITLLVPISGGAEDVRMRGFRERATVERALEAALGGVVPLPVEEVSVTECTSRVLAADVVSDVDVPPFRRATMDGFAVRADDTYGASSYDPVVLNLVGPSMPGRAQGDAIATGSAGPIMTGAPVPEGADAVLRAEDASVKDGCLEVAAPVASGKNVGRVAEDVEAGTAVLPKGRRLLPQDAGLLASIGVDPVPVCRRPVVRIVVSGDELLAPGERPYGFKIVDSNSPMLAALVSRDGGIPRIVRLPDDEQEMRRALALPCAAVMGSAGAA
jgi:molybdopterin molybdotransferase